MNSSHFAAACVATAALLGLGSHLQAAATQLVDTLATWKIDRGSRAVLEEPSDWSPAKQEVALRVLARLSRLPTNLTAAWTADTVDVGSLDAGQRVSDLLVRVAGRAKFVMTVPLEEAEAELADRQQLLVVRVEAENGLAVDVLADHVPKPWALGAPIDEPTTVIGLPLAEGPGPAAKAGSDWPKTPAALLLAAASVGWLPPTPLGTLGMDYSLFDSVVDGQKLVAGDTEAFYATLAAAGRATQAGIESAAGQPGDIVPLINPGSDWFASHRGAPVTIQGVARRATRIEVDDPLRRQQIGADHYWELYVFVPTPLIKINDRLQEDYPIVCCVRLLSKGMPTGEQIGERVRVSGFAFKRYGYPLPDVQISSSQGEKQQLGQRQETALLIGKQAVWQPPPSPTTEVNSLGWIFLALVGAVGLALAAAAWSFARDSRRHDQQARKNLPDTIELP